MAVEDLKEQIARLPEQPGVYLWANAAGQTLYVGKARSLRDRVRSYLGAWGTSPRHDALLDRDHGPRGDRHRLGDGGAGAREQPDQAAHAPLQHPAARRQELPLPPADDERGVSTSAGRTQRRGRIGGLLCRPVSAGQTGTAGDGAVAQGVRHPFVQRGHHRPACPAVPGVRHQALHRALRRRDLHRIELRGGGHEHTDAVRGPGR